MLIHGAEMVVDPAYRSLFDGLERPRDVVRRWCPEAANGDRRSRVQELKLPAGRFFLKVYAYAGVWRHRTLFITARAKREYGNLRRLEMRGFRVAHPVAYGQERTIGFVGVSFLMTRAIEGGIDLRELMDRPEALPPAAERRRLIEEFAATLRRCHDEGFFLHTPFFKNIFLARHGDPYALYLIDVPFAGILRHRLMPGPARVRDLACLMKGARKLLSRTERMRFARAYGADRAVLRNAQAYQERHYP